MDLLTLKQRIEKWEDLHTEFKEWPVHPDDLAAALCAFANVDGGQLILGVSDDRQIIGVGDSDRVKQKVDQVAYQNCEPPLSITQEILQVEDKTVVVVSISPGDQRPYRTNNGVYFVRTASGRRRASREELLRLFQTVESLYYDETLVLRAALNDLDASAFADYVQKAYHEPLEQLNVDYEGLLRNLGYIRELDKKYYPTVASILFFGRNPQYFFPQAHIVAARIPGTDFSALPSDNKLIQGNAVDMLEDAIRFLRIHLRTAHRIQGFEPESYPELPEEALREVLVNALVHRDYTISAPIRIFIFDDRVEVRTPGSLPNTVTIDAIRLGAVHVLRNPILYTLFSRLGLVTGIGTGIYRTIQQVRKFAKKDPKIFIEGNEFIISLPRNRSNEEQQ
jgi:ATP-dependent DNA helicase RecG